VRSRGGKKIGEKRGAVRKGGRRETLGCSSNPDTARQIRSSKLWEPTEVFDGLC